MTRKPRHFAAVENGKISDALASVIGEESPLIVRERKIDSVIIDGKPLSEQRARLKRPDRPTLHTEYHEVVMVADMLLSLAYEPSDISNIRKRESPDVEIQFAHEGTVFGEFTRACDGRDEALVRMVVEVDHELRGLFREEGGTRESLSTFCPHVTFYVRPESVPTKSNVVAEIERWLSDHTCSYAMGCTKTNFGEQFPVLQALGATHTCSNTPYVYGGTLVFTNFPSLSLRSLVDAIRARIAEKRAKHYPQRPLWLFISISSSWEDRPLGGAYQDFFRDVRQGTIRFETLGFDRVLVGVTGHVVDLVGTQSSDVR